MRRVIEALTQVKKSLHTCLMACIASSRAWLDAFKARLIDFTIISYALAAVIAASDAFFVSLSRLANQIQPNIVT